MNLAEAKKYVDSYAESLIKIQPAVSGLIKSGNASKDALMSVVGSGPNGENEKTIDYFLKAEENYRKVKASVNVLKRESEESSKREIKAKAELSKAEQKHESALKSTYESISKAEKKREADRKKSSDSVVSSSEKQAKAKQKSALKQALASDKAPFIISDMGDNPTAGGAGDVTWTVTEVLNNSAIKNSGKSVIYASIPGKEFVAKAVELGVGSQIDGTAGAEIDDRYAPPVRIKGEITAIKHSQNTDQIEVVVKVGNVSVIVTKNRTGFHYESMFTNLGLNPRETDILIVKIGYLVPELYNMRADWVMALTPGGVDQDLHRLEYNRIPRPMYPLNEFTEDPDLSARFIPLSDNILK